MQCSNVTELNSIDMTISLAILLTTVLVTGLYLMHLNVFAYWRRRGFPYEKPSFVWGNLGDVMSRKVSFGIHMFELYKKSTSPLIEGIFFFYRPALLVTNAELAMRMLVRDFGSFHDRGKFYDPKTDPISSHLFNMTGNDWRNMRAKLTPTFTTGKLRSMMSTILVEGEVLKKYLKPKAALGEVVDMKKLLERYILGKPCNFIQSLKTNFWSKCYNRYSLNIIASAGFGLDLDTINNPQHDFTKVKNIVNGPGIITSLRLVFAFFCPRFLKRTY